MRFSERLSDGVMLKFLRGLVERVADVATPFPAVLSEGDKRVDVGPATATSGDGTWIVHIFPFWDYLHSRYKKFDFKILKYFIYFYIFIFLNWLLSKYKYFLLVIFNLISTLKHFVFLGLFLKGKKHQVTLWIFYLVLLFLFTVLFYRKIYF